MDFDSLTAEELLALVPTGESDLWEKKSAVYLTPLKKGELKRELGKQVSAFANSGGGYVVFGISDKTHQLEPCETRVGRQSMKDYLATMTELCVEYSIRDFRVHPVPFKDDSEQMVFVVAIDDSPAAPHQALEERTYFRRIDGHSKPAPHFYLELLRNRFTKTVLDVVDIDFVLQSARHEPRHTGVSDGKCQMDIALKVTVENKSFLSATDWGVLLKLAGDEPCWQMKRDGRNLQSLVCVRGERPTILPSETVVLVAHLYGEVVHNGDRPVDGFEALWETFRVIVRAASQNYVSQETVFGGTDQAERQALKARFATALRQHIRF